MTTPTLIEDLNHKMEQQIELRRKEIASLGMKIAKSMNKLSKTNNVKLFA